MELRVHGIGGPTAAHVLEVAEGTTCRAVWRGEPPGRSALRTAPDDPAKCVYHWAPLTSGSKWFALWPLLLPFTIINVAGFMRPAGRPIRGFLAERLVHVLALATTVAWVGWSTMVGQIVFRDLDGQRWAAALGGGLALAPFLVAKVTRRSFEGFEPRLASPSASVVLGGRGLSDPRFFSGDGHRFAAWLHCGVGAVAFIWVLRQVRGDDGSIQATGEELVVGAGMVQFASVVALTLVSFQTGRRAWSGSPMAAAAGLGAALLGGLMTAALQWSVGSCPAAASAQPRPEACGILRGHPWMLVDVFGWALLVGLGALVIVLVLTIGHPRAQEREASMRRLTPTWLARTRARAALVPSRLAAAGGVIALTFLVAGSLVFTARAWPVWTSEICRGAPEPIQEVGPCRLADRRIAGTGKVEPWTLTDSPPVTIARWVSLGLLGFMGLNLVKSRASFNVLRRVGSLWDVLTVWPRSYHPLAVRPYAERAVPELQQLLVERPEILGPGTLEVSAHSQGSVLVVAALAPYQTADRTRLLTTGSPLRTLHGRAFPHYFNAGLFDDVKRTLKGRWRNSFRFTDHVGRSVFVDDERWVGHRDEHPIPDPHTPGASIGGHSGYWGDPGVVYEMHTQREDERRAGGHA